MSGLHVKWAQSAITPPSTNLWGDEWRGLVCSLLDFFFFVLYVKNVCSVFSFSYSIKVYSRLRLHSCCKESHMGLATEPYYPLQILNFTSFLYSVNILFRVYFYFFHIRAHYYPGMLEAIKRLMLVNTLLFSTLKH